MRKSVGYDGYSLDELREARRSIDAHGYPDRAAELDRRIREIEQALPRQDDDLTRSAVFARNSVNSEREKNGSWRFVRTGWTIIWNRVGFGSLLVCGLCMIGFLWWAPGQQELGLEPRVAIVFVCLSFGGALVWYGNRLGSREVRIDKATAEIRVNGRVVAMIGAVTSVRVMTIIGRRSHHRLILDLKDGKSIEVGDWAPDLNVENPFSRPRSEAAERVGMQIAEDLGVEFELTRRLDGAPPLAP